MLVYIKYQKAWSLRNLTRVQRGELLVYSTHKILVPVGLEFEVPYMVWPE